MNNDVKRFCSCDNVNTRLKIIVDAGPQLRKSLFDALEVDDLNFMFALLQSPSLRAFSTCIRHTIPILILSLITCLITYYEIQLHCLAVALYDRLSYSF